MEYLVSCQCGQKITVNRSQAGQLIACQCGQSVQVPTLRGLRDLPTTAVESSHKTTDRSQWAGWRGIVLALSLLVLGISGPFAGYFAFLRSRIDTSYGAKEEIAAGEITIDGLSANELVETWFNIERHGLGVKEKPLFYMATKWAYEQEQRAYVIGSIATTAALVAAATLISARKKPTA